MGKQNQQFTKKYLVNNQNKSNKNSASGKFLSKLGRNISVCTRVCQFSYWQTMF